MFDKTARIIDLIPKKFLIWIVCLVLFLIGKIDSGQITTITVAYITANIAAKYTPKAKAYAGKIK